MGDLNPFRYSLAELSKFLIAAIGFVGYALLIFLSIKPGLIGAIQALVVPGVGLLAIFAVGNHTSSEYNKAIVAFLTAAITVYQYFGHLDPSTVTKLFMAAGALATALGVLLKGGAPLGATAATATMPVRLHLFDESQLKRKIDEALTTGRSAAPAPGADIGELLPIKPAEGGGFYLHLVSPGNHEVLLTSQVYTTEEHAEEGRSAVVRILVAALAPNR